MGRPGKKERVRKRVEMERGEGRSCKIFRRFAAIGIRISFHSILIREEEEKEETESEGDGNSFEKVKTFKVE